MPFSDMQITLGPPSLPSIGIIHQTSKSDLWHTLAFGVHKPEFVPDVDVEILMVLSLFIYSIPINPKSIVLNCHHEYVCYDISCVVYLIPSSQKHRN